MQAIHIDTFREGKQIKWETLRTDIRNAIQRINKMHEDEESGSDSEPEADEMNKKEKQVFISPTTASKLGMN